MQHIEDSLSKIRIIFQKTVNRIEAMQPGEKIPATTLAKEIAQEFGMKGEALYFTLKFLFESYPGVEVRRGAKGGIIKLPIEK